MTLASSSVSGWWKMNIMTWKRGKGQRLERNVLDFRFPDERCVTCSTLCYMKKLRPGKGKWCILDHTPYKMAVAQLVKNLPAMHETLVWFLEDLLPLIPGRSVRKICWRRDRLPIPVFLVFPGDSAGKESTCNVGDLGSIPGLGRSSGEGNSYPLQYYGLENSMDCIIHGVTKSQTRLSDFHFHFQEGTKVIWLQIPNGEGNDLEGTYTVRKAGLKTLWTPWACDRTVHRVK